MSYREMNEASEKLGTFVRLHMGLDEDMAERFVEAVEGLAKAIADDQIDRLFNRGDYR